MVYNGDLISNNKAKVPHSDLISFSNIIKEKIWKPCSEIEIFIDEQYENEINSAQERLESFISFK